MLLRSARYPTFSRVGGDLKFHGFSLSLRPSVYIDLRTNSITHIPNACVSTTKSMVISHLGVDSVRLDDWCGILWPSIYIRGDGYLVKLIPRVHTYGSEYYSVHFDYHVKVIYKRRGIRKTDIVDDISSHLVGDHDTTREYISLPFDSVDGFLSRALVNAFLSAWR